MEPARPVPLPVNRGPRPARADGPPEFRCVLTTPASGAPVDRCAAQDAFIAEELLKLMNLSAAKIQALWRGYCARKQLYIEQGAAILLQAFWRGCRVRHVLREPVSRRLRIHGQYLSWEDPRALCPPPPPPPSRRGPAPRSRETRRWPVPDKRPAAASSQPLPIKQHPDGARCQPSRRLRDICGQLQPQPQPPRVRTPRFVCDQTQQNRLPGVVCDMAATRIQTNWRGYKVRRDMATLVGAVVYIQSFFRGYKARKKLNPPRPHEPEPLDEESDMVDFNLSFERGQLRSHGAASGMPLNGLDLSLPSSLHSPAACAHTVLGSNNNTGGGGARTGTGLSNNRAAGARSGTGLSNSTGGGGRSGNDNNGIIRSGDCISYCICSGIRSVRPGNGCHAGSVHSVSTGSNDSIRSAHCNSNDGTRTGSVRSGTSSNHSVRSVNYNNDCAGSGTGGGGGGHHHTGSNHSVRSVNYNNDCAGSGTTGGGHTGSVRTANNINNDRVRSVNCNNDGARSGTGGGHTGSNRSGYSSNHDSVRAVNGSYLSANASSGTTLTLPVNGVDSRDNPPRSFNGSAGPDNDGKGGGTTRPINGDHAGNVNDPSSIPHPEGPGTGVGGGGPAEGGAWFTRGWCPGSGEQSVLREPLSIIDEDPKSDELLPGYIMNGGGDTVSCCSSPPVSLASARSLKKRSVEEVVRAESGEDGRPRFAFRAPGVGADTDTLPPDPGSQYLVQSSPYTSSGPRKLIRYREHRAGGPHPEAELYFDLSDLEVPKDAAGCCPPPSGQPARRSLKRLREQSAAAGTIQAAWKGHRTRRALQEQVSAATKIQATFRRYQTRREFESEGIFPLVNLKAAGKKAAKTSTSSQPLPAPHRAPRQPEPRVHNEQTPPPPPPPAEKEMEARQRDAPVFAPLCTPGVPVPSAAASGLHNRIEQWARRSVRTRRQHQERDRAATAIQAVWRGLQARRRITRMARAAVMIQAWFRGYQIRKFLGSIGRNPQGRRERGVGHGGKTHSRAARAHRAAAGGQRPQEAAWRAQLKGDKPAIYVKRNPCYNPRKVTIHVKATAAEQS